MLASLILFFSIIGLCSGDPPLLRPKQAIPMLPQLDKAPSHRDLLELLKRGQKRLEESIEIQEKLLDAGIFSLKEASQIRQEWEEWRKELEKKKKYIRELERWEQQRKLKPGPETDGEAIER